MLKAMLVDDELLVCNYLRSLLQWEDEGYVLCGEAYHGADALKKIELLRPDLVFLDISMPVMDGIQMMRILKQWENRPVVIVLSSYGDFEYLREAMRLGARDYLLKHQLQR